MNCERYDDLLDDYIDGARAAGRPADERLAAFERHLAQCARCQALVADLTSIRRTASTLEEHVPPPRLWAQIAASIEQERQAWWRRPFADAFPAWVPVAVAASLSLVLAGAAWLAARQSPGNTPQQTEAASPDMATTVEAEDHYQQAIAGLQQLADSQNAALDPATRAVLNENLAVIDRAITESQAALASEPSSALAQESLLDALDTKVALLQDTVALATDTADEDAAAAAMERNQ